MVSANLKNYMIDWGQGVIVALLLGFFLFYMLVNGGFDFGVGSAAASWVILSLSVGLVGMYLAIRKIPNDS